MPASGKDRNLKILFEYLIITGTYEASIRQSGVGAGTKFHSSLGRFVTMLPDADSVGGACLLL